MNTRAFARLRSTDRSKSPSCSITLSDQECTELEQQMRSQAKAKAQAGDYGKAIQLLSHLIDINPTNAVNYNNRGLVYFQSGQLAAALQDYNAALNLNPRLASVYNNRANYHAALNNFAEAVVDYEQALDLDPSNIRARINLGITLRDLGMYERAIDHFDFALLLNQLQGHAYAERGRTYHLWGEWNCAIADYQRALDALSAASSPSPTDSSSRLHLQVAAWLEDLHHPLIFRP